MPRKPKEQISTGLKLSDLLMQKTNKQFGEGTATNSGRDIATSDYISTQCFALDTAIGRPGIPVGRLTLVQGKEASGKTTIVTQILAECQRRGGITIYLDAESAFDPDHAADLGLYDAEYVEKKGLDVEPLVIIYPENIRDAFRKIEFLIKAVREEDPDRLLCIAWDSVAATPSSVEDEDDTYENAQPGVPARQVSAGLRKLIKVVAKYNVAFICVNQEKEVINAGFGGFGERTTTIASKPLGFHASVRMAVTRIGFAGKKQRKEAKGIQTLVKISKNKIAPPHREATFDILYATGIDNEGCMLEMAKSFKIVGQSGSYNSYKDTKFRTSQWPGVECYEDVVRDLKAEVEKQQRDALGKFTPEEDEDDEEYAPRPNKRAIEEEEED